MTALAGPAPDEHYDDLIATVDLAGKVRLLTGASFFSLQGNADLGLAPVAVSDGPNGVKGLSGNAPASLLPNASTQASTWNEE